jgi:hypothetical protein
MNAHFHPHMPHPLSYLGRDRVWAERGLCARRGLIDISSPPRPETSGPRMMSLLCDGLAAVGWDGCWECEDGGGATLLADWAAHREAVNRRQCVNAGSRRIAGLVARCGDGA